MSSIVLRFFLCLLAFAPMVLQAQELNLDKIVAPEDTRPQDFEEYLVQLAWQNSPVNRGLEAIRGIYDLDKSLAKRAWMNDLSASFNLNNISLSQLIDPNLEIPVFFPIYNLQAGFNLGTLLSTKDRVRAAEIRKEIAQFDLDQKKLSTRREVLEAYNSILAAEDVDEIRKSAVKDAKANFVLMSEKFRLSEVDFEQLNQASGSYYAAQESTALSEADIKSTIIRLEELIGISYEEALKYKKKLENRAKSKKGRN